MKTLTTTPTPAQLHYDEALANCQENDTDENERKLSIAADELAAEWNHGRKKYERILRDLNAHAPQGHTGEQITFSESIVSTVAFLLSATAIGWLVWWLVQQSGTK